MKTSLLILLLAVGSRVAGAELPVTWAPSITLRRIEDRKEVEGYWFLSSEWLPYMGLALELRDGSFRYWFLSDVGDQESKLPITGKYTIEHGFVRLTTTSRVYDTRWLLVSHEGRVGLLPISAFETITMRKEPPRLRMLFRVDEAVAEKRWPIYTGPK